LNPPEADVLPAPAPASAAVTHAAGSHEGQARATVRRFFRHRLALAGSVVVLAVLAIAIFAPFFTSQDPARIDLRSVRQPPSDAHPLGTDLSGRDVWSRIVYGARTSLAVGFGAVAVYVAIGTLLGVLAGYFRGKVDALIMRVTDTVMSVPGLLMVIVFVSVVGPSLASVLIVIGLLGWPGAGRLVRGQFLSLREAEFVTAARVVGVSDRRIILAHLLPNTLGPLIVLATFGIASAIILEASLSFLGLGVRPPVPSWGEMLNAAQSPTVLIAVPWLWISPAVAIAITVLAVNFVGDGLRDALDPTAAQRRG
jgi:peptide/nickel transport system permease protein